VLDVALSFLAAFHTVFQPVNLIALVVGLVVGMIVAVLPGLTLVMGVVLALPFTYGMAITPSIILLTAMYISGTYGGAFTAILFRIPGEPLDVPCCGTATRWRTRASRPRRWDGRCSRRFAAESSRRSRRSRWRIRSPPLR
jgi:putative tricarboxylic transport membrane protein